MAAVDPTTTVRVRAHYSGPLGNHTMLFHGQGGSPAADVIANVREVISLMTVLQYQDTVWDTAEVAEAGVNLFFPVVGWVAIVTTSTNDPDANSDPAKFLEFGGRDNSSGTRKKLYLFETYATTKSDMRWNAGEAAPIDDVIDALTAAPDCGANVAGRTVIWYTYANVGSNDYLVHRARR
jgi:hypothetical protein